MTDSATQHLSGENYQIDHDVNKNCLSFQGSLRLNGPEEYAPVNLLLRASMNHSKNIILDLRKLEFLNSSGIAMFSKFVIEVRNEPELTLTIYGSNAIPWQSKSLKNLQRLMPTLVLEYHD